MKYYFQTLCNDVLAVLKKMYGDSPPAIVLVGHRLCPSDSLVSILYILTFLIVSIVCFFLGKSVFINTLEKVCFLVTSRIKLMEKFLLSSLNARENSYLNYHVLVLIPFKFHLSIRLYLICI